MYHEIINRILLHDHKLESIANSLKSLAESQKKIAETLERLAEDKGIIDPGK